MTFSQTRKMLILLFFLPMLTLLHSETLTWKCACVNYMSKYPEVCVSSLCGRQEVCVCVLYMCDTDVLYLMSSSKSHSVWCFKCSLVICSACVFFSSCVTLTCTRENTKVEHFSLIHTPAAHVRWGCSIKAHNHNQSILKSPLFITITHPPLKFALT